MLSTLRRGMWLLAVAGWMPLTGCDDAAHKGSAPPSGSAPAGLTPEQAAAVVAQVGDRTITLGEYAMTLERMNQYERLKFQTKKRRRELLQQIIDVELLAQEARRRGLDKRPEVQAAIRQMLRDAQLAKAREGLPPPAAIPLKQVKAYYKKHKEQYREPERRRVAVIALKDAEQAREVLDKARAAPEGSAWGALYQEYAAGGKAASRSNAPPELAGDRGIVGPPTDAKGANPRVPPEVRKAVFQLAQVGDVADQVVEAGGAYYIVRMIGHSKGHTRSLAEAERGIRVAILQQMVRDREAQMYQKLRDRYKPVIDEAALASIKLSNRLEGYKPRWKQKLPSADVPSTPDAGVTQPGKQDPGTADAGASGDASP